METYKLYKRFEAPTPKHTSYTIEYTIAPDPKRPGCYKVSEAHDLDNYKQHWSYLYGKCNQPRIAEMIEEAKAQAK